MEEYSKVDADINITVHCICPYCESGQDVFNEVKEILIEGLGTENACVEVSCDECGKIFIVDNITF